MSRLSNPAFQGRMRKVERDRDSIRAENLRAVMSTPAGRSVFYWLIFDMCGTMSLAYAGNSSQTDFNEGGRAIGVKLLEELQTIAGPQYVTMLQEQLAQREQEKRIDAAIADDTDKESDDNG